MTDQPPVNGNAITGADMLALIAHITDLLNASERRILSRLDDNSERATERWVKHDAELAANTQKIVTRFEKIEAEMIEMSRCIHGHLSKEHDDEVALQARVQPVRTAGLWLAQNWRSLLLALLALLGVMGWAGLEAHITTQ